MKINDFVQRTKADWERYRDLLERVERRNYRALSPDEIEEFALLYRGLSSDLATAKTFFPGTALIDELNALVSRGYTWLYTTGAPSSVANFLRFFSRGFPELIAQHIRVITFSTALFLFFILSGFVAQSLDPRLADTLVPKSIVEQFDETLTDKGRIDRDWPTVTGSAMSSFLMTNNIQVSFFTFAGGITFGLLTLYIVIRNAFMIGVLGKLFVGYGKTANFLAFIMPHGVLELTAIVLSAAAGFLMGYALINPAGRSRSDSLKSAANSAVRLMFGVVPMLIIAGLIEGYLTPIQAIPDSFKLVFSGVMFCLMIWYFSLGFRKQRKRKLV